MVLEMRVDGSFVKWLLTDATVSYLSNIIVTGAVRAYEGQKPDDVQLRSAILGRATLNALCYVAEHTDWRDLGYV